MCVKVIPESHVKVLLDPCREWRSDFRNGIRPNASLCALGLNGLLGPLRSAFANLIVDQLLILVALLEHRKELHDVRILQTKEILIGSKIHVGRKSKAGEASGVRLGRIDRPSRQNRGQGCVGGLHKLVETRYHHRPRARQREGFYESLSTLPVEYREERERPHSNVHFQL